MISRFFPTLFLAPLAFLDLAVAAPSELSIRFEPTLVEKGLSVHRSGLAPAQQGDRPSWVSRHKSVPADEWARSFLIKVTDPAAQKGNKPIVEGEIVYWHEANTAVDVLIDSKTGSRKVAQGWGNKAEWQTLRFFVDDAFFGARQHGNAPDKLQTDGFDIRINTAAGDFYVSEVRLTAFAPSEYVNFSKSLQLDSVTSSTGNYYTDEGKAAKLKFAIKNTGAQAFEGTGETLLLDWQGKAVRKKTVPVRIAAGTVGTAEVDIPPDLAPDIYLAAVRLNANGVEGPRGGTTVTHSFVVARPDEIFIVLDSEPIARGIEIDGKSTSKGGIDQGLATHPVWIAEGGSSALAWGRALRFKVTDPRFQNGRQPAVDLDLIYRQQSNAPVSVILDTAKGPRKVGEGWGRNPELQRLKAQIDDAFLGARSGGEGEEALQGHDIRVNSYNEPLAIRALKLRGYETSGKVDLSRLLRFDGVKGPRPILVSPPNSKEELRYTFRNISQQALDLAYRFILTDWDDRELNRESGIVQIPKGDRLEIPYLFQTAGLANGVYHVKVELAPASDPAKPAFTYETNVGVSSVTPLKRAAPGEFLYGIDSGEVFSFDWFDYLGADITRRFPIASPSAEQVEAMITDYEKRGMTSMIEADPPGWNADAGTREAEARAKAGIAADIARKFRGRIKYWELGNEPDLTFFYAGPMTDYSAVHAVIAAAILKEDPNAIVMNGGLSFAGEEASQRAREFAKIVPPESIVGWAYHGHGSGVASERQAYDRMVAVAREAGKDRMPLYIETESGVAAVTKPQQMVQAATCIQKMVFAQSVKAPLFIWFRHFITGGDSAYTNLKTPQEPRPVALAYRAMVENLRGLKHSGMVDLKSPDAEGHYFESADGGKRAVVLWCNQDTTLTVNLGIADNAKPAQDPTIVDFLGNRSAAPLFGDGTVPVTITTKPVFLTWNAPEAGRGGTVVLKPSLIQVPRRQQLFVGETGRLNMTVHNPSAEPLMVELSASSPADSQIEVSPLKQQLAVPPNGKLDVPLTLRAQASSTIHWPVEWTAFLDVNSDAVDLSGYQEIPKSLPGVSAVVDPRVLLLRDNELNLQSAVNAPVREKRAAAVFGVFDSPVDQTVRVGAAADWWFSCSINGKEVYSTMEHGNGGQQALMAHTFDLPVRKGRNLVAFKVLSGSMGFKLVTGGPDELQAAIRGVATGRTVELALSRDGHSIAKQVTSIDVMQPPVAIEPNFWGSDGARSWWKKDPQFEWESVRLVNTNEPKPDAQLWFKGQADLSAVGWIGRMDTRLYLVVRVSDDQLVSATDAAGVTNADRMEIRGAGQSGRVLSSEIALGKDGSAVIKPGQDPIPVRKAEIVRNEATGQTLYIIEMDSTGITSMNARLTDSDAVVNKQTLTWLEGWDKGQDNTAFWLDLTALPTAVPRVP